MKKAPLLFLSIFWILGADISGGDIKFHDLMPNSDALKSESTTPVIAGCGAPPAGYFVWLDGDDPTDSGLAAAGEWADKGREGRIFSQNITAHKPIFNAGYVQFDGVDDYLKSGADSSWSELFGSGNHFCSMLVRKDSQIALRQTTFGTYADGAAGKKCFFNIIDGNGAQNEYYLNSGNGQHIKKETVISEVSGEWYNIKFEYDRDNLRGRNGINSAWSSYVAAANAAVTAPISSTFLYHIGGLSSAVSYAADTSSIWNWSGGIAQILCYDNLAKEADVESWMTCKKGEL